MWTGCAHLGLFYWSLRHSASLKAPRPVIIIIITYNGFRVFARSHRPQSSEPWNSSLDGLTIGTVPLVRKNCQSCSGCHEFPSAISTIARYLRRGVVSHTLTTRRNSGEDPEPLLNLNATLVFRTLAIVRVLCGLLPELLVHS